MQGFPSFFLCHMKTHELSSSLPILNMFFIYSYCMYMACMTHVCIHACVWHMCVCTCMCMPNGDQKTTFGNQSPPSTRDPGDQTQWPILPAPPHIFRGSQTVLQYECLQPAWLFPSLLVQKRMQLRPHGPFPGAPYCWLWAACFKSML